ncbi:hypothetical protein AHAS_Ahas19G0158900 [Arachis hypogaea]
MITVINSDQAVRWNVPGFSFFLLSFDCSYLGLIHDKDDQNTQDMQQKRESIVGLAEHAPLPDILDHLQQFSELESD